MPSPIGHSLISFSAYLFFKKKGTGFLKCLKECLLAILLGNLPDMDFIPGILAGSPKRFHQTYTHTLGFAVLVAGLVWLFVRQERVRLAFFSFILVYLHCIADSMNYDSRPPAGVMLFWPVTDRYFLLPLQVFFPAGWDGLKHIFSQRNIMALVSELTVGFLLILVGFWKRYRRSSQM